MNVREVVEVILAVNGGRKIEKTCDLLIEGDWDCQVTGMPSSLRRLHPNSEWEYGCIATMPLRRRLRHTGANFEAKRYRCIVLQSSGCLIVNDYNSSTGKEAVSILPMSLPQAVYEFVYSYVVQCHYHFLNAVSYLALQ